MRSLLARTVRFGFERDYLFRGKRVSWSEFRSAALLAPEHAAGDLADRIVATLYYYHGGELVRLREFFSAYRPEWLGRLEDPKWLRENLAVTGYYFGRLEGLTEEADLPELSYIGLVRDPRELLVSEFLAGDGGDPERGFRGHDPLPEGVSGLEDYVRADENRERMRDMLKLNVRLGRAPNAIVRRYEDLMADPKQFMHHALLFTTGHEGPTMLDDVVERFFGGPPPKDETDRWWGRYREVLSEETRDALWREFGELLAPFGYREDGLGPPELRGGARYARIN